MRQALFAVLTARGLVVDEEQTAAIRGTCDQARLARWVQRAAVAGTVDEVFADVDPAR